MIFEHYVPEQLPYGANIILTSIDSSLSTKIPVGGIEFITSKKEITTMTFQYQDGINGTLVDIVTNLNILNWNKTNKTFKVSNKDIFSTGAKPYIQLCCNKVKLPISFVSIGGITNKWYNAKVNTDDFTIYGYEHIEGNKDKQAYAKFGRYITISWNTDEPNQTIFIEKNTNGISDGSEFYGCYAYYFYLDGNTIKKEIEQTVFTGLGSAPSNGTITIPRLDGKQSSIKNGNTAIYTKKFYKYFMLGILVRITGSGYEAYKHHTVYYIKDSNKTYNNTDFLGTINGEQNLLSQDGIPLLLSTELNYKWNSNFFYTTESGKFISPSSSQIYFKYDLGASCTDYSLCYTECRGNTGQDCSCNFNCNYYDGTYCKSLWGCYQNNGVNCTKYYKCYQDNTADDFFFCTCDEFCESYSKNFCIEYYACNHNGSNVNYCEACFEYYKKYPTRTCWCHIGSYCEDEGIEELCPTDCPTNTTCPQVSCPDHNQHSGNMITVPALRQVGGVWGADCTRRAYDISMGGIWKTKQVFIPAGDYPEVTYYGWPGGFKYGGYFNTYP